MIRQDDTIAACIQPHLHIGEMKWEYNEIINQNTFKN